jgi:YfiH family protein
VIVHHSNGAAYLQFEQLADFPEIAHGVFERKSGCSHAPFDRLNVSFSVGDDPLRVQRNRRLVAQWLEAPELVFSRQVHGDAVRVVDAAAGAAAAPEADAMVTAQPGRFLVMQVADCQSILMYDPRRRVVANVHSGWRGSVANIAGRTLKAMQHRFGCSAADVRVGIGPSLGPCCAEFVHYRDEIPRELWGYRRGAAHFDFWAMSRDQLMDGGIPGEQIEVSGLCTKCHTQRFFSYRADQTTGRFPAVIGLR